MSEFAPGMMIVFRGRISTPCVGYCKGLLASAMMRTSAGVCDLRGEHSGQEDAVFTSTDGNKTSRTNPVSAFRCLLNTNSLPHTEAINKTPCDSVLDRKEHLAAN